MAHHKRKRLFVDCEVQRLLIWRVIAYWLASMATLELLSLTWTILSGPEQPGFAAYFASYDWGAAGVRMLLAMIVLVPILRDALSFSNRFAGPVYRMGRILKEVARSGHVETVRLRRGDYWQGFADDLNAAMQRFANPPSDAESSTEAKPATNAPLADADPTQLPADGYSAAR